VPLITFAPAFGFIKVGIAGRTYITVALLDLPAKVVIAESFVPAASEVERVIFQMPAVTVTLYFLVPIVSVTTPPFAAFPEISF